MTIQELKPSKRVKGRWLAVLDDGSILRLGEQEVIHFALYAGRELTDDEAESLVDSARRSGLKEKTIALLARKPMSRHETMQKLLQWEAGEEEAAAICDRMEELGFLNDGEYAARVIHHYGAKGYGPRKLREELRHRGVPREYWDEALEGVEDQSEMLDAFIAKKLAGKTADRKEIKKVSDALARRGFSWSEIDDAMRKFLREAEEL